MSYRPHLLAGGLLAALTVQPALAQDADYYRGGWRTEEAEQRIYQFVIRGDAVSGITCTRCADAATLEPLHGSFSETDGIRFTVRHLTLAGELTGEEELTARLAEGKLIVRGPGGEQVLIKDPRGPTPGPYEQAMLPPGSAPVPVLERPAGAPQAPAPYVRPSPWRQISADDVTGVWLGFGTGMQKQYFLIRKDGDALYGLACGRCDNPYTHGALENFRIEGDRLTFDIVHQDWGEGSRVPFTRHVTAWLTMNEMHMDARRDDAPDRPGIVASLVGPVALEATAGNRYEE